MHIAYSAINARNIKTAARFRGYQAACDKHAQTIAAIRQYMPNWEPAFAVGSEQFSVSSAPIIGSPL